MIITTHTKQYVILKKQALSLLRFYGSRIKPCTKNDPRGF